MAHSISNVFYFLFMGGGLGGGYMAMVTVIIGQPMHYKKKIRNEKAIKLHVNEHIIAKKHKFHLIPS